jgi:hypothetical protein
MSYCGFGAVAWGGQTLVGAPSPINSPGVSEPILNASFKVGKERIGAKNRTRIPFRFDRVGR